MMRDDSELEGAYRLFSNPDVSPRVILESHFTATAERALTSGSPTIVVHDTTDCCFGGEAPRAGIGRVSNEGKGMAVHVAMALAPDGTPHGLLDLATHTRLKGVDSKRTREKRPPWQKESARWGKAVDQVMRRLGESSQVLHVMDREADNFLLFEDMLREQRTFVIRVCHDRRIADDEHEWLLEAIEHVDAIVEREVALSRRSDRHRRLTTKRTHPAREGRKARLAVGARTMTVICGRRIRRYSEATELTLNFVRVWEPEPPEGEAAVEWLLITNLPTSSPAQLEVVVDAYRVRWTIEEYFKALKSGCAIEQRQLESRHALENALAILAPIACRLLLLRTLARTRHDAPAREVLTSQQLAVLRVLARRFKLPNDPSVRDALLAIAGLGGFLKRNGEPGWKTIGLGFEELLQAEIGWKAAKAGRSSDQW